MRPVETRKIPFLRRRTKDIGDQRIDLSLGVRTRLLRTPTGSTSRGPEGLNLRS